MADFDTYKNTFPHARFTRSSEGVLEVVLHTDGGSLIFNGHTHEEFVDLFHQINQDDRNRVVVLTGAGEAFIDQMDVEGFDFFSPRGYDKIYREGKKVHAGATIGDQRHFAGLHAASGQNLTLGTPGLRPKSTQLRPSRCPVSGALARWQAPVCFERSVRESPFWIVLADIQNRTLSWSRLSEQNLRVDKWSL